MLIRPVSMNWFGVICQKVVVQATLCIAIINSVEEEECSEPETARAALATWETTGERSARMCSFGQVVIVFSCLVVLAMFHAVQRGRLWRRGALWEDDDGWNSSLFFGFCGSETADRSCERCSKLRNFFQLFLFPSGFSNAIFQNDHKNTLMEEQLLSAICTVHCILTLWTIPAQNRCDHFSLQSWRDDTVYVLVCLKRALSLTVSDIQPNEIEVN